ncbi:glycosyltransferase family 4 protein [bacterium]|nr:glycosyltransferase family 4 protein [bacterium]MCI0605451.1 glycosyltransferase family 4 protein [bacterium]
MATRSCRIGIVSTRLAGTDGVSLEVVKWVNVLQRMGHTCFFFAGECQWPADRSYVVPEAHFDFPEVLELTSDLFDDHKRDPETSKKVDRLKNYLKAHLHKFVQDFEIRLMIVENALSIPMNVPLGLALTEMIAETGMLTLGHHHDFFWERSRFAVAAADDYLRAAFPPTLHSIRHSVINSFAQRQLALRTGASSLLIPNVMDFDSPPPESDGYADDLRATLGISPDEYFLLQPTRVVPRKRIERAIELAGRLNRPCTLVISHASGDEGSRYMNYLREYIDLMKVRVVFAQERFSGIRGRNADGSKVYSLADAHFPADLITYPSSIEGFGNGFLEAIYYRKPILMSAYEIYRVDIRPKGFRVIEFEDYITGNIVSKVREVLENHGLVREMTDHNYVAARRYYSYTNLETLLAAQINLMLGD